MTKIKMHNEGDGISWTTDKGLQIMKKILNGRSCMGDTDSDMNEEIEIINERMDEIGRNKINPKNYISKEGIKNDPLYREWVREEMELYTKLRDLKIEGLYDEYSGYNFGLFSDNETIMLVQSSEPSINEEDDEWRIYFNEYLNGIFKKELDMEFEFLSDEECEIFRQITW